MRVITHYIIVFGLFLTCLPLDGQNILISGSIFNNEDSSPVYGCVVTLNPGVQSSVTNQNGEFFFKTTPGKKELLTRILGFRHKKYVFTCNKDTLFNILLEI